MGMPRARVGARHTNGEAGEQNSVAVVLRLVGAGDVDAEVLGLLLGQLGEFHTEGLEVGARRDLGQLARRQALWSPEDWQTLLQTHRNSLHER